MSKTLSQIIKEKIKRGEEINVAELAEMVDLIDEKTATEIRTVAPKNQRMAYIRNTITAAIRSEGHKVLNTGKNRYKPVTTYDDIKKYRKKRTDRILKDFNEVKLIDEESINQGIPVPVAFFPEMEEIAREVDKANDKSKQTL